MLDVDCGPRQPAPVSVSAQALSFFQHRFQASSCLFSTLLKHRSYRYKHPRQLSQKSYGAAHVSVTRYWQLAMEGKPQVEERDGEKDGKKSWGQKAHGPGRLG